MINSKRKGKIGELEWAGVLKEKGWEARRGVQYSGDVDAPDVVCQELPIHWEVKRQENLNVHKAVAQAIRDCPKGKWRVVAHRKGKQGVVAQWLVTLPADDFLDLLKEWHVSR